MQKYICPNCAEVVTDIHELPQNKQVLMFKCSYCPWVGGLNEVETL